MSERLSIDAKLRQVDGVSKLYYQPPESIKITYPCIIYQLNNIDITHANNATYRIKDNYIVTIIDKNPDSKIPENLMKVFPTLCTFNRFYVSDNLNHWVFNLYLY